MNNLGFHGPPVQLEKGKEVFRIVIVGSSYVSAIQVPVRDMHSTCFKKTECESQASIPMKSFQLLWE